MSTGTEIKNFTATSAAPYDKHYYRVYFKGGKTVTFRHWEEAQAYWFQWAQMDALDRIEALDVEELQPKGIGFK